MPNVMISDAIHPVIAATILVVASIAVVTDVRRRRIYNVLTFPTMALGLVLNAAFGGVSGLLAAVAGLLLGGVLFYIPVAYMGRGAGDLKLLAALGALGGPIFVAWCALFCTIAGGIFAFALLLFKRRFLSVVFGMAVDVYAGQAPGAYSNIRLPYAIPMAVGAIAALAVL